MSIPLAWSNPVPFGEVLAVFLGDVMAGSDGNNIVFVPRSVIISIINKVYLSKANSPQKKIISLIVNTQCN